MRKYFVLHPLCSYAYFVAAADLADPIVDRYINEVIKEIKAMNRIRIQLVVISIACVHIQ